MIKCPRCKELIGPSAPVYKASRGFVDGKGNFYDDEGIVMHIDCYYDFTYDPFEAVEQRIKEGKKGY